MTEKTRLPSSFFINPRRAAAIVALLVLLAGLILGWHLSLRYQVGILAAARQDAESHLKTHGSILNVLLQHRFGLLAGLKSYSEEGLSSPVDHNGQTFRALAVGLCASASGVRNFSIAPEGIQKYVYPLEGNENVLGHDLMHDKRPAVRAEVQRAIETGEVTLSGPYELRQGGLGLVARQAVYQQGRFWGLVAMVLDVPPILMEAGLNEEHELMSFVLQDQKGKVFFGDASILTKQPVSYQVPIQGHVWILSAVPINGWQVSPQILWLVYGGAIVLPILLAALAYLIIYRHARLEQLIVQRTKALRESKQHFEKIVAQSPIPMVIADAKGDIEYYNDRFIEVFGYTIDDISTAEQWWPTCYPDKDYRQLVQQSWSTAINAAAEKGVQIKPQEWTFIRKDGSARWVEFAMMPVGDISVNAMNDITERKHAEEERASLNAQLDAKNKELERVINVASHDLRSPLVNIQGFSGVLGDSLREILSILDAAGLSSGIKAKLAPTIKNSRESIRYINEGVSNLVALLDGLLEVSRLGIITLKSEELDMNMLMSNICGSLKFQCEEQGAIVKISELPSCHGDEIQINQLFANLIGNALKYSAADRSCIIKISGQKDGAHSIYCVEDNGVGIAPEFKEKIFDIFHQIDPEGSGEGLGLNIVHRIVERHNGRVWVESEPGKGSRFYFSLLRAASNA